MPSQPNPETRSPDGLDPFAILRDSWRITFRTQTPWILSLLLCLTMIPVLVFSGGFSLAASSVMLQDSFPLPTGSPLLPELAPAGWVVLAGLVLLITVAAGAASWILQAASIRAVLAAADGGRLSTTESLRLGPNRIRSILLLSLTFGAGLSLLSLAPALLALPFRRESAILLMIQSGMAPLTSLASIALYLILMSIAVEDLRPAAAAENSWKIFRAGWWGFLLVLAACVLIGVFVTVVLAPFFAVLAVIFSLGLAVNSVPLLILGSLGFFVFSLILLVLLAFSMVFSTVLYSLTYRASARVRTGTGGKT
jgi:hypothetical protein